MEKAAKDAGVFELGHRQMAPRSGS